MIEPRMLYSFQADAKHHRSNPVWLWHDMGALVIDGRDFVKSYVDGSPPVRKALPYEAPSLGVYMTGNSGDKVLIEGRHGDIWIANRETLEARPLAFGSNPSWSPEGDAIAFFSNVAGASELLVMRPTGIPFWPVGSLFSWSVGWSPSGRQLVSSDDHWITIVNIDGSDRRKLAHLEWYGWGNDPRWSSQGDLIAYYQHADENRLFVIDLDGKLLHAFTDFKNLTLVEWSPNGERVVAKDNVGIHVIHVESEKRLFLAEGRSPCWSRTGKQILFSHEDSVYVVDVPLE